MEQWISEAVGIMHVHGITQKRLAEHIGVTNDYISMLLRGKKTPKNAKTKIMTAINEIINKNDDFAG